MAFSQPAGNEPQTFDQLLATLTYVPVAEAPEYLQEAIRRRAAALSNFVASTPESAAQPADIDVERVIYLVGTARLALEMIAAAAVELGITVRAVEEVVRWMDVRPVALNPGQPHIGIDIAYIVAFRTLTRAQRWLLHSLAGWSPPPATISREFALNVASRSGEILQIDVSSIDMERLVALGFADEVTLPAEDESGADISPDTRQRIAIAPYIRYIAQSGLDSWPIPEDAPEEIANLTALQIFSFCLVVWAANYAAVIAGPTITPIEETAEDDEEDDDVPQLMPEPSLEALTDTEFWAALQPEMPHFLRAALLARDLGLHDRLYLLCQMLTSRLRLHATPDALAFRRTLLEVGLVAARENRAAKETLILATQLTDAALDEGDLERADVFAGEALTAAISHKDMRAVGFATRRQAAIAIRRHDAEKALTVARQAVALAQAGGDEQELAESITLLDMATRLDGTRS